MNQQFTAGDQLGFNVSMFFNSTLDEVNSQIYFCGKLVYGTDFISQESFNKTFTVKYRNLFLSYQDTI